MKINAHNRRSFFKRVTAAVSAVLIYRPWMSTVPTAFPDMNNGLTLLRRPMSFDAMLQLWDEMSEWDLMHAALVEVVDEATQVDANSPATVW